MKKVLLLFILFLGVIQPAQLSSYCIYFQNNANWTYRVTAKVISVDTKDFIAKHQVNLEKGQGKTACYNWKDIYNKDRILQSDNLYISNLEIEYWYTNQKGHLKTGKKSRSLNSSGIFFGSGGYAIIGLSQSENTLQIEGQGYKYPSGLGGSSTYSIQLE